MQLNYDRRNFMGTSLLFAGTAGLLGSVLGARGAFAQTLGPMRRSNRYEDTYIFERKPYAWPGNKRAAGSIRLRRKKPGTRSNRWRCRSIK